MALIRKGAKVMSAKDTNGYRAAVASRISLTV